MYNDTAFVNTTDVSADSTPKREFTSEPAETIAEPPLVTRMVVEIRSDGKRTVARGAVEDVSRGERVAVHVEGASPIELVRSLVQSAMKWPSLLRTAATSTFRALPRPRRPSVH